MSHQQFVSQEEESNEHNAQVVPPGFHVIFLPYSDDLRKLTYEATPKGKRHESRKFGLFISVI